MSSRKKSTPPPSSPEHSAGTPLSIFADAIQELKALGQPWSPVVQAALQLLMNASDKKICETKILEFPYAKVIHEKGAWTSPQLIGHAQRASIGIVLAGRAEVVTLPHLPPFNATSGGVFCGVRPWPRAVLRPGDVLGSYEFTGQLFQRPENHAYLVYSGPVCLQFDHPEFCPFNQKYFGGSNTDNALFNIANALGKGEKFKDWIINGESYKLVESVATKDSLEKTHLKVLIIHLSENSESFGGHAHALRRSIIEAAWGQSYPSRSRSFRAAALPGLSFLGDKKSKAFPFLASMIASIERMDAGIKSGEPNWSPPSRVTKYPALESFIKTLAESQEKNLQSPKSFALGKVYLANTLNSIGSFGAVSLSDHLHRFADEGMESAGGDGDEDNKRKVADDLNTVPKGDSPLKSVNKKIKKYLETFVQWESYHGNNDATEQQADARKHAHSYWPSKVSLHFIEPKKTERTGRQKAGSPSKNPFQRFRIEIDPNLSTLPALQWVDSMKQRTGDKLNLSGTCIVACQHLLRETACWFSHLKAMGAKIIIIGKDYSTSPKMAIRMRRLDMNIVEIPEWEWKLGEYEAHLKKKIDLAWKEFKKLQDIQASTNLLVVDDGGYLLESIPSHLKTGLNVRGVEQTTSGMARAMNASVPVVCVAGYENKRKYESKLIAEAIIQQTGSTCPIFGDSANCKVGVLGAGAIGAALIEKLALAGYTVFHFSISKQSAQEYKPPTSLENKIIKKSSAQDLVAEAHVIFGCTGEDLMIDTETLNAAPGKWFASCGSMDTEFKTLLKCPGSTRQREHLPFSTVSIPFDGQEHAFVLNGGFPINFDREPDSVPLRYIQYTRSLMHCKRHTGDIWRNALHWCKVAE